MSRLSLRARLTLGTAAATLLAMTALVGGIQSLQRQSAVTEARSVLASRTAAAAATVQSLGGGRVKVLETPADTLDDAVWVYDAEGRLLDGQPPARPLVVAVAAMRHTDTPVDRGSSGRYLLRALPVLGAHHTPMATVVAAVDLRPYDSGARRGLWLSVLLGAAAVLAAAAASWAAATRSLQRVHVMADQADDWREHDLDQRFPAGGGDELGDLGSTLNRMLDRISATIQAERRLTDGVAHELRTPLSVIRAEAQLAQTSPDAPHEPLESIVRATERMDTSIDALLAAARGHHDRDGVCRVDEVLRQAARDVRPPEGVSVQVAPTEEELEVAAPPDLVVAILKPLVDNAVHHAVHEVRLRGAIDGGTVLLHVDDDGPGIPQHLREAAFTPGVSSRQGGTGLGLPLALRLARSAGGSVSAGAALPSRVTVTLPRP
jgi:two-component system OmpR family sensor kinase